MPPGSPSTSETSPTSRRPASSSRTSRRCWPTPTPSGFAIDGIADHFAGVAVDRVIGIEARGFILAAPVAYRIGAVVRARSARPASCRGRSPARSTPSSTAPTSWRSTATPSIPASGSSSSTTCWPPAARPRPRCSSSRGWRRGGRPRVPDRAGLPRRPPAAGRARHRQPRHLRGAADGHRRPGPAVAPPRAAARRRGGAAHHRLPHPPPEGADGPDRAGLRAGRRRPSHAVPQVGRELHQPPACRWPASWPTSASTTPRSPPPCCTTPSRTPTSSWPTSSRPSAATWPPSSTASPSSTGCASTPRRSSRPPPCARCWWPWPRTSGS